MFKSPAPVRLPEQAKEIQRVLHLVVEEEDVSLADAQQNTRGAHL